MGFRTYLLYIIVVFIRPFEQFFPELADLRPVLILWVLTFVFTFKDAAKVNWGSGDPRYYRMLASMAMVVILSIVFNSGVTPVFERFGDFSTPAMLFVLTCMNLTSVQRYRTLALVFMCCILGLSLESLYSYHTGWQVQDFVVRQMANENAIVPKDLPPAPADDTSGTLLWRLRSVGFLADPNDFGQTIVVVLPWVLMFGNLSRPLHKRAMVMLPVLGPLMYALQVTHSRGGVLGAIAATLVLLQALMPPARFKRMMVVVGVAGVGLLLAGGLGDRALSTKEQSANERIDAWNDGMMMLKTHPLFGVGYGSFSDYRGSGTAHNSFVLCFAETGLIGYLVWLGMIVLSIKTLNRVIACMPRNSEAWWCAVMMRSSFAGFLVCAWFLSRTFVPTLYILMGMVCSLMIVLRRQYPAKVMPALHEPVLWGKTTVQAIVATVIMVSLFIRSATM